MKGTITPGDKYNKVTKIMEASSLEINMDTPTTLSAALQVLTQVVQALIVSGEKLPSEEAMIEKAKSIADKILHEEKSPEKDLE